MFFSFMYAHAAAAEMCEAEPQDCVIDRISEMNEDGECHYSCAEGYEGTLCNSELSWADKRFLLHTYL